MLKIGIIVGSTRPGRKAEAVAKWVYEILKSRKDAEFEIVDVAEYNLPLLDEPVPPLMGQYSKGHSKKWAAKIDSFDAFIFVTPEYNHGTSAALKNAIDFLYREWNNKAAGFVGYGSAGGVRAVENLRLVMGEIKVADVRAQVMLSIFTDFENFTTFKTAPAARKGRTHDGGRGDRLGRSAETVERGWREIAGDGTHRSGRRRALLVQSGIRELHA